MLTTLALVIGLAMPASPAPLTGTHKVAISQVCDQAGESDNWMLPGVAFDMTATSDYSYEGAEDLAPGSVFQGSYKPFELKLQMQPNGDVRYDLTCKQMVETAFGTLWAKTAKSTGTAVRSESGYAIKSPSLVVTISN